MMPRSGRPAVRAKYVIICGLRYMVDKALIGNRLVQSGTGQSSVRQGTNDAKINFLDALDYFGYQT